MKKETENLSIAGEKKKEKSVKKIKKERKLSEKAERKETKKLAKKQKQMAKKYNKKSQDAVEKQEANSLAQPEINEFEKKSINAKDGKTKQEKVLIVRRAEHGKPMTKKRKILNFISYALVGIIAIAFGYIGGNFYYVNYMDKPNYDFDTSLLKDDGEQVYNSIKLKTPDRCTPIQLFVATEYCLSNTENYQTNVVGSVIPSIAKAQTVRGVKGRNGNVYFVENYSKGMVSVAEKSFYDITTKTAEVYEARDNAVKTDSATFPSSPSKTYTLEEYLKEYGTSPTNPVIPYVVSSKTYIVGSESFKNLESNKYEISFALTKDTAVADYVKQVKHMSGLANYPKFKSVMVKAVIEYDATAQYKYKFVSLRYDEKYTVNYFGVSADCTGWLENTFVY